MCHSFCYRKPSTVSYSLYPLCEDGLMIMWQALELLLYYFIAAEVGIANYIQRVSCMIFNYGCDYYV